jgi:hypothetical protein
MNLRAIGLWCAERREERVPSDSEDRSRGRYEAGAAGPEEAAVVVVVKAVSTSEAASETENDAENWTEKRKRF